MMEKTNDGKSGGHICVSRRWTCPQPVQPEVDSTQGHQFCMGTFLDDASVVHDKDPIGDPDGGWSVRNNESGLSARQPKDRILNEPLGLRIHA